MTTIYYWRVAMAQVESFIAPTPFHSFVCLSCGKTMGKHFIYRPESLADVRGTGRKPDGKYYCDSAGVRPSGGNFQRELANTLHPDYERKIKNEQLNRTLR